MVSRVVAFVLTGFLLSSIAHGADEPPITLSRDGHATTPIIIPAEAPPAEQKAAEELALYLNRVTGGSFRIESSSGGNPEGSHIFVGPSDAVKKLLPDTDFATLKDDGIVIKTVGKDLILAGGGPRGTLYAVYEFLEEIVGCEWWNSREESIPKRPTLEIPRQDIVYTPPFWYRDAYFSDITQNPEFAVKMRRNGKGDDKGIPAELGGHLKFLGWVHTFDEFVPSKDYFEKHPEWGAEHAGVRRSWSQLEGQPCLSNREFQAKFLEETLKRLKGSSAKDIISVSQNDNDSRCTCEKCLAVEKKEGAASGSIIHFVNGIAREVAKEHPNALVETLAYRYSSDAPQRVKPDPNVLIRLCTYTDNHAVPFTDPKNQAFQKRLDDWGKISNHLFIWDYTTDFDNQWMPRPNLLHLADNIRFFQKNKVEGLFSQGAFSQRSDFIGLRAWLLSHLIWNPNRDPEQLITRYLKGYYGPAAAPLREYIQLVHEAGKSSNAYFVGGGIAQLPFPASFFSEADRLFNEAETSVASDPKLLRRVQIERLSLDYLRIQRYPELRQEGTLLFPTPEEAVQACDTFLKKVTSLGFDPDEYIGSAGSTKHLMELSKTKSQAVKPLPEKLAKSAQVLDFPAPFLRLYNYGTLTNLVPDENAAAGQAAEIAANRTTWGFQLSPTTSMMGSRWKLYAAVRYEGDGQESTKFVLGAHNDVEGKSLTQAEFPIKSSPGFELFEIPPVTVKDGTVFYFSPIGGESTKGKLLVDRFILVRQ